MRDVNVRQHGAASNTRRPAATSGSLAERPARPQPARTASPLAATASEPEALSPASIPQADRSAGETRLGITAAGAVIILAIAAFLALKIIKRRRV